VFDTARLAFGVAVLVACATPVSAQLYKWTDANGRVQYSDRPPPSGARSEIVSPQAGSGTGANAGGAPSSSSASGSTPPGAKAPLSYAEKDQAFRKRQIEQEEARQKQAKADDEAKRRTQACSNARSRLAGLDAGGRQVRFDEKGERQFLDEAQIEREKAAARADIGHWCR